jgi:hypothetical protein
MTETYQHVPHPGSRLDAVAQAEFHQGNQVPLAEPEPQYGGVVVATRSDMPEECIPRTLLLGSANPYLTILPRDMRRRRAVVIAGSVPVVLCETKELAQQVTSFVQGGGAAVTLGVGGYLPANTVIVLESRSWLFAAITAQTASPVTVIVERYAEEP